MLPRSPGSPAYHRLAARERLPPPPAAAPRLHAGLRLEAAFSRMTQPHRTRPGRRVPHGPCPARRPDGYAGPHRTGPQAPPFRAGTGPAQTPDPPPSKAATGPLQPRRRDGWSGPNGSRRPGPAVPGHLRGRRKRPALPRARPSCTRQGPGRRPGYPSSPARRGRIPGLRRLTLRHRPCPRGASHQDKQGTAHLVPSAGDRPFRHRRARLPARRRLHPAEIRPMCENRFRQ